MSHPNRLAMLFVSALLVGCPDGQDPTPGSETSSGTAEQPGTDGSGTVAPTTGTTGSEMPTTGTSGSGESGTDTDGIDGGQCDPWSQDCPDGFKCMAFAEEGEAAFTGTKCTPVAKDPGTDGDACKVEGGWWTGIDDCDYGHACWNIDHATNTGDCVALCTGNQDSYSCAADGDVCVFWVPGLAHVCLQACEPLLQDCPPAQGCLPEWAVGGQQFTCKPEYSGDEGKAFDPCMFANSCDPGLLCWDPAAAIECDQSAGGCCLPFCDLDSLDPQCTGAGAVCGSFYEAIGSEPPPDFSDLGICALPG